MQFLACLHMKFVFCVSLFAVAGLTSAMAQERIYRCGNSYTNTVTEEQSRNCKLVSGGNVTVVQAVRANPAAAVRATPATSTGQRVDSNEQRAKDTDTRMILDSELKKAEALQEDLVKQYNNGEPEKLGPETRNHQKYLDRVAELKANITRNEADIAGLRRELGRAGAATGTLQPATSAPR